MQLPKKKTLCEQIGHSWQAQTASNYRLCQRSGCRAAQRLEGATWMDVQHRAAAPSAPPAPKTQMTIWEKG
jgi:hypothetical protein